LAGPDEQVTLAWRSRQAGISGDATRSIFAPGVFSWLSLTVFHSQQFQFELLLGDARSRSMENFESAYTLQS